MHVARPKLHVGPDEPLGSSYDTKWYVTNQINFHRRAENQKSNIWTETLCLKRVLDN